MGSSVDGLDSHVASMKMLSKRLEASIDAELNQLGNEWLGKTIDYTPHDTGFLASGAQAFLHTHDGKGGWHFEGVKKENGTSFIELVNQTSYALPVEYGHRMANGKFCKGHYMLRRSRQEAEKALPKAINRAFKKAGVK